MSEKNIGDVITRIRVRKTHKGVVIYFASGEKIPLSQDSYVDFRLYEGKEMSSEEMKKLLSFGEEDEYYSYALKLLSKEVYTSHDLLLKMTRKGASVDVAKAIVKRLREAGLIDDEAYARVYATDLADFRLYGKNKTLAKLREKGIPPRILETLVFPPEKELERACRYVEVLNKKYAKTPSAKKKQKAFVALLEKGYDREIAYEAIEQNLNATPANVEEESLAKDFYVAKNKYLKYEDLYVRKQKIFAYLSRKGYRYEDIKAAIEEEYHED